MITFNSIYPVSAAVSLRDPFFSLYSASRVVLSSTVKTSFSHRWLPTTHERQTRKDRSSRETYYGLLADIKNWMTQKIIWIQCWRHKSNTCRLHMQNLQLYCQVPLSQGKHHPFSHPCQISICLVDLQNSTMHNWWAGASSPVASGSFALVLYANISPLTSPPKSSLPTVLHHYCNYGLGLMNASPWLWLSSSPSPCIINAQPPTNTKRGRPLYFQKKKKRGNLTS